MTSMSEQVREAVTEANKADDPVTSIVAHTEVYSGAIPAKWLTHRTTTPSGKEYGALTLGAARKWLESLGIKLVENKDGRPLRTYTIEVEVRGFHTVTVEAWDENEAVEEAIEMAQDDWMDLDYDASVVSVDPVTRGRGAA